MSASAQPERIPEVSILPTPVEIAKIAAALKRRDQNDETAIGDAIRLYLRSLIECRKLAPLSLEEMILQAGDEDLMSWALGELTRPVKLRLYPDDAKLDAETRNAFFEGGLDPVRLYLKNLRLKSTRMVKQTLRLFFVDEGEGHNEAFRWNQESGANASRNGGNARGEYRAPA